MAWHDGSLHFTPLIFSCRVNHNFYASFTLNPISSICPKNLIYFCLDLWYLHLNGCWLITTITIRMDAIPSNGKWIGCMPMEALLEFTALRKQNRPGVKDGRARWSSIQNDRFILELLNRSNSLVNFMIIAIDQDSNWKLKIETIIPLSSEWAS